MQFQVPQFIDVEDKIFGPFTFKQFLYMAGGAGISFVLYKTLPFLIAIIFILPLAGFALALTFAKVNEKPFSQILESYFKFTTQSKLYVWKKIPKKKEKRTIRKPDDVEYIPKFSDSRLKDISWSLDVLDVNKK